jgi:hypothetical protein
MSAHDEHDKSQSTGVDPDRVPLADALRRGLYTREMPPRDRQRWPVEMLDKAQREALEELVEVWWPQRPMRELIVATDRGWEVVESALSVVLAAAALNTPLSPERWADVFASGALTWPGGPIAEWLRHHYTRECQADALAVIESIRDGRHLLRAATALPDIDGTTAGVLLERVSHVSETAYLAELLKLIAGEGHADAVRDALTSESQPERQQAFWRVLAAHGDLDSQLALVGVLSESARAGEPMDGSLLEWHAAAHDERLIDPLGELLALLEDAPDPMDVVQRSVRVALAATRSERALAVYDQLAQDPDRPARAFQWYPREELARDLATEQVLRRLPESPVELLELMQRLGFPG